MAPHAKAVESCVPPPITNTVIDFLHKVSSNVGLAPLTLHFTLSIINCSSLIDYILQIPYRDQVYQTRVGQCTALSNYKLLLATLKRPIIADGVIKDLEKSWKMVQTCKEEFSMASLNHLATINASISSFLAKFS